MFAGLLEDPSTSVLHLCPEGRRKRPLITYNVFIPLEDNLALLHCGPEHFLYLHLFESAHPERPPCPCWEMTHVPGTFLLGS